MNSLRNGFFFLSGSIKPFPACPPRNCVMDQCRGLWQGPYEHHPHPALVPDLGSEIRLYSHSTSCLTILTALAATTPVADV